MLEWFHHIFKKRSLLIISSVNEEIPNEKLHVLSSACSTKKERDVLNACFWTTIDG